MRKGRIPWGSAFLSQRGGERVSGHRSPGQECGVGVTQGNAWCEGAVIAVPLVPSKGEAGGASGCGGLCAAGREREAAMWLEPSCLIF